MYLQRLVERNPTLLETAIELHQSGRIPPNTWIIDLDVIAENARVLTSEAKRLGLTTYLMSKQYCRNPYVNLVAIENGLHKTVAVDMPGALQMRRYSIPIGHMGHLNQIPRHLTPDAVAMRPEVITVYNLEHARWINDAATDQGITQDVLIRVYAPGDIFFEGQEGGFSEEEVTTAAQEISKLANVRLVGVTAFPCVRYNRGADDPADLTPNFYTILRAADTLRRLGIQVKQINAPGNTSSITMPMLAESGATHVEPGHGLLGTTPNHVFQEGLPERPTYTYVSEISHHFGGRACAYGGGLFQDIYQPGYRARALVGSTWEAARNNSVDYLHEVEQIIDYHAILQPGDRCRAGDTVLFGFRTQMQMTRSYIAPVSGISSGEVKLHYLFDHANTALDEEYNPVDPATVREDVDKLLTGYAARMSA
jgi:predicted amino acid racemase